MGLTLQFTHLLLQLFHSLRQLLVAFDEWRYDRPHCRVQIRLDGRGELAELAFKQQVSGEFPGYFGTHLLEISTDQRGRWWGLQGGGVFGDCWFILLFWSVGEFGFLSHDTQRAEKRDRFSLER